jgi:large repetitive protein
MPPSRDPERRSGATHVALCVVVLLATPSILDAQGFPAGPEFRINTYTTGNQRVRSVAASANNTISVVTWESAGQDGSQYGIYAQRYGVAQGGPLGGEFRINTFTVGDQTFPSVASDQNSNFVVVWHSQAQDGSGLGLFGQRYSQTGVPLGGEFRVNTHTTQAQSFPDVSRHAPFGFVVVWQSFGQDGSGYGIFGQRYDDNGAPLGPEFQINTYGTGTQRFPSVTMDTGGNFAVVWEGYGANEQQLGIFGRGYDSTGAPVGPQFQVNTYTTGQQRYPSVDKTFTGFVVAWQSEGQDGSGYGVFARHFAAPGAPMTGEFKVNGLTASNQVFPAVSGADNRFTVTWQGDFQDGSATGIGARFVNFNGVPFGGDRLMNSYTTGPQTRPVISYNGWRYWTFAWTSAQDPDGSLGVYAQDWTDLPVELQTFVVE